MESINKEEIQLVNPLPQLVEDYKDAVAKFIELGYFTLEEWNTKYKFYRDKFGYCIINYFTAIGHCQTFVTSCEKMIKDKNKLNKRFKIKIIDLDKFQKRKSKNGKR